MKYLVFKDKNIEKNTECIFSVTENPYILQNFLKLTERTDTSANHVESPANSNKGAPQDTTWTNNVRLQEFTAHVEANYQKILPDTPKDFYVNKEQTKIGIINGGIRLEWIRGIYCCNSLLT